jgi:hypothetical protein
MQFNTVHAPVSLPSYKEMNLILVIAHFVYTFSVCCLDQIQERIFKDPIVTYRSDCPHECTYGKSPFPALDNFIESITSFGSVSGCYFSS